jgi:hypothetical protein
MSDPNLILKQLPPYKGEQRLLEKRQDTFDIIREILKKHSETAKHYDRIAVNHWQGDALRTAEELYKFLKKNAPYKVEPTLKQTVKTPSAILAERTTFGNDCKHYASYIIGVGDALRRLGYPVQCFYRFGNYGNKPAPPGHVFAVWKIDGREYWMDPVPQIKGFNARNIIPRNYIDKTPLNMNKGIGSLYEISGVDSSSRMVPARTPQPGTPPPAAPAGQNVRIKFQPDGTVHWSDASFAGMNGVGRLELGKKIKKAAKKVQNAARVNFANVKKAVDVNLANAKKAANKVQPGKIIKKVGLSTARNAFLLLVKGNIFGMARRMWLGTNKGTNEMWKKLSDKWVSLGGNPSALMSNIKQGVKVYNRLHPKKKIALSGMYMGAFNSDDEDTITGIDMYDTDGIGQILDLGYTYDEGMSVGEIIILCNGLKAANMREYRIGEPVSATGGAALIAAAAPILTALAGLLKALGVNQKKIEDTDAAATDQVGDETNEAIDKGNVLPDGSAVLPDGTQTKVTKNADGSQTITIDDEGGATGNDGGMSTGITKVTESVKDFYAKYQTPILITGAAVGAFVIYKVITSNRVVLRRRK